MDNFNLKKYLKEDKLNENESILSDEEMDLAGNMLRKMHQQLNPTLDVEKSKAIMDFTIATLQEMY
tara:strand:- start:302 stop:499 length:198 start_codon:yes stop_codon:yes gene_type:complete